jgi:hypothetical protein
MQSHDILEIPEITHPKNLLGQQRSVVSIEGLVPTSKSFLSFPRCETWKTWKMKHTLDYISYILSNETSIYVFTTGNQCPLHDA